MQLVLCVHIVMLWFNLYIFIAKLLSKLESLMMSHPTDVLRSIKEYIGVENFQEGTF